MKKDYHFFDGKTLFFDFDGTLANTEPYHVLSKNTVLKKYGIQVDDWKLYISRTDADVLKELADKQGLVLDIPLVIKERLELFKKLAVSAGLQPYASVRRVCMVTPNIKYLLTRQRLDVVEFFLLRWNMQSYFKSVISLSHSDVTKGQRILDMGFAPEDCVLFDDVPSILEDARKRGIRSILVRDGMFVL